MRFLLVLTALSVASAWTNGPPRMHEQDRRGFLSTAAVVMTAASSPLVLSLQQANAAPSTELFVGKLSIEDAKKRFQMARKDLSYLLDNYSTICRGGGDAVRNYLGTQGVTSNLYGIQKVLKLLQEEADDLIEYSETMEEFNAYYYQAEGAAYQSMFAGHSSSKSTSESLLATAKKDIAQMAKYMDQLAVQLNL